MFGSFMMGLMAKLLKVMVFLIFVLAFIGWCSGMTGNAEAYGMAGVVLWVVAGYMSYLSRQTVRIRGDRY